MDQLNDNADKFGGKIVGIEPGSGLMKDTANSVKAYDLKLQLVEGSTAAMTAALKSATDRKESIAVTIWEPSWMMQKYDEVPGRSEGRLPATAELLLDRPEGFFG